MSEMGTVAVIRGSRVNPLVLGENDEISDDELIRSYDHVHDHWDHCLKNRFSDRCQNGEKEMTETPYDEMRDETEHLEWLPLSALEDDPYNARTTYEEIDELAASIDEQGLLEPITVRQNKEGRYVILMGHRRFRAIQMLNWTRTRVVVKHGEMVPADILAVMISENGQRMDLNPVDEMRGLQRLQVLMTAERAKEGLDPCTDLMLAKKVGRTQPWVSRRLSLQHLESEDLERVRSKRMSVGAGTKLGRQNSGTVRPGAEGKSNGAHFSVHHPLARKVQRRCESLNHKLGPHSVGGVGCGACWETVIKTEQRNTLTQKAIIDKHCGVCDSNIEAPDVSSPGVDEDASMGTAGVGSGE